MNGLSRPSSAVTCLTQTLPAPWQISYTGLPGRSEVKRNVRNVTRRTVTTSWIARRTQIIETSPPPAIEGLYGQVVFQISVGQMMPESMPSPTRPCGSVGWFQFWVLEFAHTFQTSRSVKMYGRSLQMRRSTSW